MAAVAGVGMASRSPRPAPGPARKVLATLDREWDGLARHRDFPDLALDNNPGKGAENPGRRPEKLLRRASRIDRAPGCPGLDDHRHRRTQRPRAPGPPHRLPERLRPDRRRTPPPEGTALEQFLIWQPTHEDTTGDRPPPLHTGFVGPA
ncbi:hypothetical protein FRACA_90013 [Frankia canadensis]|uniref:Transposase n=1 Tax=Frankia canadensis TaxID=1836972 RepID=A0A2I2L258_9ACTN|nr:hypothetical protein FRACA_90013 [Frankia canadensis]SOU59300.1 hypothetical protein FRACA_90013 [Frankia canadensis]